MIERTFGEVICDPSKATVGKRYQFADSFNGFGDTEYFGTLIAIHHEWNYPFENEHSTFCFCREILTEEEVEEYRPYDFSERATRLFLMGKMIESETILTQIVGFEFYGGEWVAQTPYLCTIPAEGLLKDFRAIDGSRLGEKVN